ncbi:MAG TPA: hypothetical protein VJN70_17695 [Gemmatimonadaceae bacterium]|nr:hypothetical protein [Gemmatimonadaceae bacterium]
MRTYRWLVIAAGALVGVSACAGRMPPHQQLYAARYGASLVEVARQPATKQRYGATTVISPTDSSRYAFEDQLVAVRIGTLYNAIRINVRNKSEQSIKLIWDEASFIDVDGTLSRVMHIGVKYADRNSSQPPTMIPAQQRLADDIFPTNRVFFRPASGKLPAAYQNGALLRPTFAGVVVQAGEPVPAAPDSFTTAVHSRVGHRFAVVIPFEADGVKNEYTFWFKVDDASVKVLEQP